jgi:phage gp16-like protein
MPSDRRALLARVHIASKEMALTDDSYRAILKRVTGQESAADCSDGLLTKVLDEFKRLGWMPKVKRPTSTVPHVRKVFALWTAIKPHLDDGSDAALRSFVERQTGITRPEWLDATQANKVIEGLKAWLARVRSACAS